MARSVTGLFIDQAQVDRIVGILRDAGFDADQISVAAPDGLASGGGGRSGRARIASRARRTRTR